MGSADGQFGTPESDDKRLRRFGQYVDGLKSWLRAQQYSDLTLLTPLRPDNLLPPALVFQCAVADLHPRPADGPCRPDQRLQRIVKVYPHFSAIVALEAYVLLGIDPHPNVCSATRFLSWDKGSKFYNPWAFEMDRAQHDLGNKAALGKLSPAKFVDIASQFFEGLAHLHDNGIIHLDIKPQNVLYDGGVIKICDFGSCVMADAFAPDEEIITKWYRPPEAWQLPVRGLTAACDIWSAGCMLFEILTQKALALTHEQYPWIDADLPSLLDTHIHSLGWGTDANLMALELITRCLAPVAADRPSSSLISSWLKGGGAAFPLVRLGGKEVGAGSEAGSAGSASDDAAQHRGAKGPPRKRAAPQTLSQIDHLAPVLTYIGLTIGRRFTDEDMRCAARIALALPTRPRACEHCTYAASVYLSLCRENTLRDGWYSDISDGADCRDCAGVFEAITEVATSLKWRIYCARSSGGR